jgi:hypothetical protein
MPGGLILLYAIPPLLLPVVDSAWRRWGPRVRPSEAPSVPVLRPTASSVASE